MNEIIFLILIFLTILTTFSIYKMLDKRGYYFSLVIMNLLGLILSFKVATISKINVNLNIIPVIAVFTIIYVFITKYGYKENKNIILISLYSNMSTSLLIATMNYFVPAITETISINMQGTFAYNYKILIVYPIIMAISQYIVIRLYKLMSELKKNISINVSLTYIITGLIPTMLFSILSYINILELKDSLFVGISTYIIGILVTLINLLIINYLINKKVQEWKILY